MKTIGCLDETPRLRGRVLFEITVGEFQADLGVIRIEIGDLVKDLEARLLSPARV